MKFVFKAKNQEGQVKEGEVEAVNREAAIATLQEEGLMPFFVNEDKRAREPEFLKEIRRIWEGVSQKELAVFFRELATLLDAKVPVVPSLRAIESQVENKHLEAVARQIANDIEDGTPFSEAIGKHPNTFSNLIVNLIKSGEISGNLQRSTGLIAENIEKNYRLTSRIRTALLYPGFVLTVTAGVGFLAITFILPRLTSVIKDMGVTIPWYTKVLMAVGDFMSVYWWAVLIVIAGIILGFIYYIKTESGRKEWDQVKINLPIVGKIFRFIYLARFADNLSILLSAGIPIVRALMVVSEVVNNSVYQAIILRSADEVKAGGNIHSVFSRSAFIPPIVARMIRIGEETGKTSDVLGNVAGFYEQEIDRITSNLTALIEPVLIVFLGMGVAIMVFAILLPIYNIAGQL